MKTYTIGQLAKAAGVGVETVRYYERRKLITQPPRLNNGYRRYSTDTADRIRFIKRNQSLGFTLREIGKFLALVDGSEMEGRLAANALDKKMAQIEAKIAALKETLALLRLVKQSLSDCHATDNTLSLAQCLETPVRVDGDGNTTQKTEEKDEYRYSLGQPQT